jgi:hypothetical protein
MLGPLYPIFLVTILVPFARAITLFVRRVGPTIETTHTTAISHEEH